jgi:LCP family protein required for cell wall assembly
MGEINPEQKKNIVDAKKVKRTRIYTIVIFLTFVSLVFILLRSFPKNSGFSQFLSLAKSFLFAPNKETHSIERRVNILVLGKGGKNHEAADLTDTIIFTSISTKGKGITLVSLPRDIWISKLRAKLNSAYFWGNQQKENGGLALAKATAEEIVGQPIHYALVVDFSGFKEIVDDLGGIEVEVERSFVDEKYPIPGKEKDDCEGDLEYHCRYETLRFEKGLQVMDGEMALKFVRSRNAQGDEGTDIARAKRQQKVISAIQKKILSPDTLFSPKKISSLLKTAVKYIETDIGQEQAAILARYFLQSRQNIKSYVLDEDFLIHPPKSPKYDNLYVFVPKSGDWNEIHQWVDGLLP